MAQRAYKVQAELGATALIPLNLYILTNASFNVVLSEDADLTYSVQHTLDDVFAKGFDASTATWFDHETVVDKTASAEGKYTSPVAAVRLSVTSYTAGSAAITLVQAGVCS
jgi:hypothetical protein